MASTQQSPVYNQSGEFPAPGSIQINGLIQAPGFTGTTGPLAVSLDGTKPVYRSSAFGLTFYSAAAAVLVEVQGGTKTVRVKQITLWAQAATKFYAELSLLRCTAVSAGTQVVAVIGQHDSLDPAATAVINSYAAAAAAGTGHAVCGGGVLSTSIPSATEAIYPTVFNFCANGAKGFILRGAGDVLEVLNNTLTEGTATFGFEVVWEEDIS